VGWPLAVLLWIVGGVWHRFVGNIKAVQIGFSVMFSIAWLSVMSVDQATKRFSDITGLLTDGAILLSLLAACVIVLEFSAVVWARRDRPADAAESASTESLAA
jgi:hypothetical protein